MTAAPDVVIVGAGAAGLAAGRTLRAAGVSFRVLEASARTGGRAFTESESLGQPWDHGCHWLHDAEDNPFVGIAETLGFRFLKSDGRRNRRLHLGRRMADAGEQAASLRAVHEAFEAIAAAGEAGRDVAAAEVLAEHPCDPRWAGLVRQWVALMTAQDPETVSTLDYSRYRDTDHNWPVIDGYGALVRAAGADVPVTLSCPVRRIDWSGPGVRLETDAGTLTAKAAIVTVSTQVIADGHLGFFPALPPALAEAFAALPLGVAEKVALSFDRDVFGIAERTGLGVLDEDAPGRGPFQFQLLPGSRSAAIGHVAGEMGARLLKDGPDAMAAAALDALCAVFGEDVRRHVRSTHATGWAQEPFIRGAYSCALPGQAEARTALFEPLAERIHFAGEAVHPYAFSTAHGAHLSGITAAERCIGALAT